MAASTGSELFPGFAHRRRGTASYQGVLRTGSARGPLAWACNGPGHDHPVPDHARRCAERELNRRREGGREVLALLRCGPCSRLWPDDQVPGVLACPRCSVPLERLKVLVLERSGP